MVWSVPFDEGLVADEFYGHPISAVEAQRQFGDHRAPVTQAAVVYKTDDAQERDRRFLPRASAADFFSSLVVKDGRYYFSGFLNGWGGLSLLELASIEQNTGSPTKKGTLYWSAIGREDKRAKKKKTKLSFLKAPEFPRGESSVLVKLYKPLWTEKGYHEEVPGFIWYYSGAASDPALRRVAYGSKSFEAARQFDKDMHGNDSRAVRAYHFGHRYAKEIESRKDRLSYHTGVFVEWDHGEYGTVFELAWCYGIGGYNGRSNWVEDTEKSVTELFAKMPAEMKVPFKPRKSEIRCIDVKPRNIMEFTAFLEKHTGKQNDKRFLDPKIRYSADVQLVNNTKAFLINSAFNRIRNNIKYAEPSLKQNSFGWNCQTFAAGFYGLLTNTTPKTFTMGVSLASRLKLYWTDPATGEEKKVQYKQKQKRKGRINSRKHLSKLSSKQD